jgi:hypothetical protein
LSKRTFIAHSWLTQNTSTKAEQDLSSDFTNKSYSLSSRLKSEGSSAVDPDLPPLPYKFKPSQYLVPGWSGGSLFSKQAVGIKKLQEELWKDALLSFRAVENMPKTLMKLIHAEFVCFVKNKNQRNDFKGSELEKAENLCGLDFPLLWKEISSKNSVYKEILSEFINVYCFRVATIYLFKLKFFTTYSDSVEFSYTSAHITNPTFFVNALFKKGSSYEINCQALKSNQYSWYRPSQGLSEKLNLLAKNFKNVSVTQMMKLSSYRKMDATNSLMSFEDNSYSHALSHQSFGQFLNQLLLFFPLWRESEKFTYPREKYLKKPKIYNTKFTGDHIESLGQSHWLAQEKNMNLSWSEILCPDFPSQTGSDETFLSVCQELQFLTFLVHYSQGKSLSSRDLILEVTKEKYKRSAGSEGGQINLFSNREAPTQLVYDRVVLNIGKLPKKNPHHFLVNQIQAQKKGLSLGGHLVVLSNQKLFVPSQSKKIEALLKDFKVEGLFNFEKLVGRGEISNFIYILKKRDPFYKNQNIFNIDPKTLSETQSTSQESCKTFRLSGELNLFSRFDVFVEELFSFFKSKSSFSTSVFQKNLSFNLNFDFHQDAIIEGKLLSSLSHESENITHPQFFKNLTKNCLPFERFFFLDELSQQKGQHFASNLLGISNRNTPVYASILIVDLRDPMKAQLEICTPESYLAKREEYGNAYFQYYGLNPKVNFINLNLLREYFDSQLGQQITQICLAGGASKMKGKLRSLLIPNFFNEGKNLDETELEKYYFLKLSKEQIFETHPQDLKRSFESELKELESTKESNSWLYLSLLSHAKIMLTSALEQLNAGRSKDYSFTNPLFIDEVVELDTFSIYPNEEVYTELLIEEKQDLQKPLERKVLKSDKENNEHYLEVFSGNTCLIKFHGELETLMFIEFILSQAIGQSMLDILQSLKIPKTKELQNVFSKFSLIEESLSSLFESIDSKIKTTLSKEIAQV